VCVVEIGSEPVMTKSDDTVNDQATSSCHAEVVSTDFL